MNIRRTLSPLAFLLVVGPAFPQDGQTPALPGRFDSAFLKQGFSDLGHGTSPARPGRQHLQAGERILAELDTITIPADGRTLTTVKIRLLDASGKPLTRPVVMTVELGSGRLGIEDVDTIEPGVQLRIQGEGSFSFEAPLAPGEARLRISSGPVLVEGLITFVPELRPMVAVGIVEGAVHFDRLKEGDIRPATAEDGFEDELHTMGSSFSDGQGSAHGRVAMYLKGVVKGETLLTLALDTDKDTRDRLFRDIDPESQYPIYGDHSERVSDAQSRQKLYVRVDHGRSFLFYGDLSTQSSGPGLLARNPRSLTGVHGRLDEGGAIQVDAFASRESLRQTMDELPAKGISGPYALSHSNGVVNSEKVEIITRDRNHPALILKAAPLQRYVDYDFEPFSGNLLFRKPVPSLDENLNPQSIRVMYEVDESIVDYWVGGASVQARLGSSLSVGASWMRDNQPAPVTPAAPSLRELTGANALLQLHKKTFLQAEAARSVSTEGVTDQAHWAELRHDGDRLRAKLFSGEAGKDFLNPSSPIARGRKESGLGSTLKLTKSLSASLDALHSEDSVNGGTRDGLSTGLTWAPHRVFSMELGTRRVMEEGQSQSNLAPWQSGYTVPNSTGGTGLNLAGAPSAGQSDLTSVRAKMIIQPTEKLGFTLEGERDLEDREKRLFSVGSQYRIHDRGRLYLKHEVANSLTGPYGLSLDQRQATTVFGAETEYLPGAHVFSEVRDRSALSGRETDAAAGLRNRWVISERLQASTLFEKAHSLKGRQQSSTSAAMGLGYSDGQRSNASTRLEWREEPAQHSRLGTIALTQALGESWNLLARDYAYQVDHRGTAESTFQNRAQIGAAWRDSVQNRIQALLRTEHRRETIRGIAPSERESLLFSNHLNFQATPVWNLSTVLAAKVVEEQAGTAPKDRHHAQMVGVRSLWDLGRKWDLGLQASVLRDNDGASQLSCGVEAGRTLMKNLWLSAGYNIRGFHDRDFSEQLPTQKGGYMRLRWKFDETLFGFSSTCAPRPSAPEPFVPPPPPPVLGVAKAAGVPRVLEGGAFDVPFTILVKNLGGVPAPNVQVVDQLAKAFPAPAAVSISGPVQVSGALSAPQDAYNGATVDQLLSGNETLAAGASATITFTARVNLSGGLGGTYQNQAVVASFQDGVMLCSDLSTDGSEPDPNGNGNAGEPGEDIPTSFLLQVPKAVEAKPVLQLDEAVLHFVHDGAALNEEAESTLAAVVASLKSFKGTYRIRLVGHTSKLGGWGYNRILSRKRAESVAHLLEAQGIDPRLIEIDGKGYDEPLDGNETVEGRARNRRVEVQVITEGSPVATRKRVTAIQDLTEATRRKPRRR